MPGKLSDWAFGSANDHGELSTRMTAKQILAELKPLGSESYKRMLCRNHNVSGPCYGVKIGDMKKIQKRIGTDYQLARDLYATGNYDAMYLAGLIADDARMTSADLQDWVKQAEGGALAGATVAWVAAGSPHGWDLALKWIDSDKSHIAEAGWSTLSHLATTKPDDQLDIKKMLGLVKRVEDDIKEAPHRVRYAMNGFLISVGSSVAPLTDTVLAAAERLGQVAADLGNNDCQIPFAPDYIRKVASLGKIGKKRKTAKC